MLRQNIILNNYFFIADLYKADTDLYNKVTSKFVMLRKFNITNNIIQDTDIYFIDKELFKNSDLSDGTIIYPLCDSYNLEFSDNLKYFNPDFTIDEFKEDQDKLNGIKEDDNNYNIIYKLFANKSYNTKDFLARDYKSSDFCTDAIDPEEANILCDKVRIYHPNNKLTLDGIIYFDNFINNIHFHYYCRKYKSLDTHSENEFRIDNNIYSECIEILIPNIEDLFSKRIFFIEDTCQIATNVKSDLILEDGEGTIYCSLYLLSMPCFYNEDIKIYYTAVDKTIENCYLSYPINITLFPYNTEITSDTYILSDNINSNKDTFVSGVNFTLSSTFGFINGKLNIINRFNYPNKERFKTFSEAYQYYNNVSFDEYTDILLTPDDSEWKEEWDNESIEKQHSHYQHQCAFKVIIASDTKFKNIIYNDIIEADDVDDFSFDISEVFNNWNQLPELVLCQCQFIDKYLGTNILGNFVIMTKEYFKYLVNDINIYRLNINSMNNKFNFIDKVTCIIKNEVKDSDTKSVTNYNPKIIYKPIFYRVADLQNIQIRVGLNQNIGINLADYMTKVETFKLVLDTKEFVETARNDIFVIFKINANILSTTSGTYHIMNQDDEYISSGSWYTVS